MKTAIVMVFLLSFGVGLAFIMSCGKKEEKASKKPAQVQQSVEQHEPKTSRSVLLTVLSFDKDTEILEWRVDNTTELLPGVFVGADAEGVLKMGGSQYDAKELQPGTPVRITSEWKDGKWVTKRVEPVRK